MPDIHSFVAEKKERRLRVAVLGCALVTASLGATGMYKDWRIRHPVPVSPGPSVSGIGTVATTTTYTNPATEDDLSSLFDEFNERFFDGYLPKIAVRFQTSDTWAGSYLRWRRLPGEDLILISPTAWESTRLPDAKRAYGHTLLHEMAHAFVAHRWPDSTEGHGPHWKAKMRHLAGAGALDDLLWSKSDAP